MTTLTASLPTQRSTGSDVTLLHGVDPETGRPATWAVAPAADADVYRVERADGHITHPAVWMQARRDVVTADAAQVTALTQRVLGIAEPILA